MHPHCNQRQAATEALKQCLLSVGRFALQLCLLLSLHVSILLHIISLHVRANEELWQAPVMPRQRSVNLDILHLVQPHQADQMPDLQVHLSHARIDVTSAMHEDGSYPGDI